MNTIAPDIDGLHNGCFIGQPFFPSGPYFFHVDTSFGQFNKKGIISRFTLHKAAIKFLHIRILQTLTQPLEPFATAGFNQCHGK